MNVVPTKKSSPASIGGSCAIIALFAPLVNAGLFFLISLPLIFAAFVLSIVAMAKGRVIGGIALLMSLMIVGPGSCEFMINRDKFVGKGHWQHQADIKCAKDKAANKTENYLGHN